MIGTTKGLLPEKVEGLCFMPRFIHQAQSNRYRSAIKLVCQGREYNAKSIVSVLKACVKSGMEISIQADGEDEAAAVEGLASSVRAGLGE